jgi:hypothetical protein
VNDLKPSSLGSALNSSSTNNITVADNAFVFNGTDSYIKINDLTNPSGAWIHSVATWVKFTDFDSSQEVSWIGDADSVTIRQSFTFPTGGETVTMGISGSNVQFRFASPLTVGKWHHVVYTYNGGSAGSASTAYQVFVDDVEASKFAGVGTGTLTLPADSALWIGRHHNGTNHFGGSIANFRLFNRALTSDEIYQLYAYQKEDFGHSTNNMTLKAGRLGIGTSEPRAALDVRGIARFKTVFFGGRGGDNGFDATDQNTRIGGDTSIPDQINGDLALASDNRGVTLTSSDAAGVYVVFIQMTFKTGGTTSRGLWARLRKNGVDFAKSNQIIDHITSSTYNQHVLSALIDLDVGDTVTHFTDPAANIMVYNNATHFYMYRIST